MNLLEVLDKDMGNPYTIYCDMDGVLCDFDSRFDHFTGLSPDEWMKLAEQKYGEKVAKQRFWDLIDNQVGMRFWRGMSWMPEGQQLWDYIKRYSPILLTAPSFDDSSREGKTLWVQDNLGPQRIEFRQAKEKSEFAGPNQILIDDREDTIQSWKSQNGIGLLYKGDTGEIIRELQKMGL